METHFRLFDDHVVDIRLFQELARREKVIQAEQGKRSKDRLTVLSPRLLEELRGYFRRDRPGEFLFPSRDGKGPLCAEALKHAFAAAKRRATIEKPGGIPMLS